MNPETLVKLYGVKDLFVSSFVYVWRAGEESVRACVGACVRACVCECVCVNVCVCVCVCV